MESFQKYIAIGWLAILTGGTGLLTRALYLTGWPSFVVLLGSLWLIAVGGRRVMPFFTRLPVGHWLHKAQSLARALWSFARWGDVRLSEYNQRSVACATCPQFQVVQTGYFCSACGCPRWAGSDLRSKWRMADVRCPLGKW